MQDEKLSHVKAVILDWAGAVADHGCIGPVAEINARIARGERPGGEK